MKETLLSALRHALTALAGLGGYLASAGWLDAADASAVDAAGASVAEAGATIGAALVMRLMIFLVAKIRDTGAASGFLFTPAALGLVGTAAVLGTALPSCSPADIASFSSLPIHGYYYTDTGRVGYSAKGGLTIEVDGRSGK